MEDFQIEYVSERGWRPLRRDEKFKTSIRLSQYQIAELLFFGGNSSSVWKNDVNISGRSLRGVSRHVTSAGKERPTEET